MKTLFPKILLGLLGVILISCEDDVDRPPSSGQHASIQFEDEQQSVREDNVSGLTVTLTLNRAAPSDGKIKLKIKDNARHRLQTNPAHDGGMLELPVMKGRTQLQFTVKARDNSIRDGDIATEISIEPSAHFTIGEPKILQLTILDDEDPAPVQSVANFMEQVESVSENREEIMEYKIQLSSSASIDSKIVIQVTTDNAAAFVTNPVAENGKISLTVPAGTAEVSFTLNTINDSELLGHTETEFSISTTTGSIIKGTHDSQKLTISDDELAGKLRGYETVGPDVMKRFYEYDSKGRIAKMNWENFTSFKTSGTDTYFYDEQDRLVKINKYPGRDVHLLWNNDRIERLESYQDGTLKEYANYAYDDQGNVGGLESFYRQRDGSFKGSTNVYLYFYDGNIYKALSYTNVPGSEEPVLVSTRTYDHYLDSSAPISMVEIIPGVKSQTKLAGSYRVESNDSDISYTLTYEFRPDGLPSKRTASAPGDTQTTVYYYY